MLGRLNTHLPIDASDWHSLQWHRATHIYIYPHAQVRRQGLRGQGRLTCHRANAPTHRVPGVRHTYQLVHTGVRHTCQLVHTGARAHNACMHTWPGRATRGDALRFLRCPQRGAGVALRHVVTAPLHTTFTACGFDVLLSYTNRKKDTEYKLRCKALLPEFRGSQATLLLRHLPDRWVKVRGAHLAALARAASSG